MSANIIDPGHPAAAEREALRFRERVAETPREIAVGLNYGDRSTATSDIAWALRLAEQIETALAEYVRGRA